MKLTHLFVGLSLILPLASFSTNASAAGEYYKCRNKEDPKKKKKCNKNYEKWLGKEKARTEPYAPSALSDKFASLDAEGKNPFAGDDFYFGTMELGITKVDELMAEIYKVQATVKMAKYVGYLHKDGQKDEATALASSLLPELIALKDVVTNVQEKLAALQADIQNVLKENPTQIPKVGKLLAVSATSLTKTVADLPGVIVAITPIAKGAVGAAKEMAVEAATGAVK